MAGVLGSIGAVLAWIVIIMMQIQMAALQKRIEMLEKGKKL